MVTTFDELFDLQRALEARLTSDWLHDLTTSPGPFPPVNIFQQGNEVLAIIELPGIDKGSLQVQAQENTIRIAGKKITSYPEDVSVHRRERISGEFDRTISSQTDQFRIADSVSGRSNERIAGIGEASVRDSRRGTPP